MIRWITCGDLLDYLWWSKYSREVLTQKITQAVYPLRGYTLFSFVRSGK